MRRAAFALVITLGTWVHIAQAAQLSARDRLETALRTSRELVARAQPMDQKTLAERGRGLQPTFPEDQPALGRNQFPRLADAQTYWSSRPWVVPATRQIFGQRALSPVDPAWPRAADAAALRALLGDNDSAIRSLAIEALSALHLPEDVGRINALVR